MQGKAPNHARFRARGEKGRMIKDKTMVYNACYTEWSLETLKGIKSGCMNYPPEVIPSSVEKGRILLDEKVVLDWKPRV